jgi:hypothetical protein
VSSKSLSDSYCTNSHYARVGGISTQEINALELEFLTLIDWHLATTGPILQQYYANLVEQHPCYERLLSVETIDNAMRVKRRRSSAASSAKETDGAEEAEKKEDWKNTLEEQSTKRHFDSLLDDDSIPYIA